MALTVTVNTTSLLARANKTRHLLEQKRSSLEVPAKTEGFSWGEAVKVDQTSQLKDILKDQLERIDLYIDMLEMSTSKDTQVTDKEFRFITTGAWYD